MFIRNNLSSPTGNPKDDVAFSAYAKHQQELNDIVQASIQKILSGESNFTLEVDDDFSEGDLAYIEKEIYRLLGE